MVRCHFLNIFCFAIKWNSTWKFISKLPGIKNGTVKHVNFSLSKLDGILKLDVDSIGCLIDTFANEYNTKSRNLMSITISLGSLAGN